MKFDILDTNDSVTNVALSGNISGRDIAPPADPLRHSLGANCYSKNIVLHLADTEYVDSMGVSWLINCNKKFREAGGKLVLHSLHPTVLNILRVLRLESVLNIAPDAVAANKLVRGEAS